MTRILRRRHGWLSLTLLPQLLLLTACVGSTHDDEAEDVMPNPVRYPDLPRDAGVRRDGGSAHDASTDLTGGDGGLDSSTPGAGARTGGSTGDGGAQPPNATGTQGNQATGGNELCAYDNQSFAKGAKFTSKDGRCQCVSKGNVLCWKVPNKPGYCLYNGTAYRVNQSFQMKDHGTCACYEDEAFTCAEK